MNCTGALQIPIGIAIATLIDIIAKATERTTAKAAIASEAATALVRRADATGAKRPPNHPLEPDDRIMSNLHKHWRITPAWTSFHQARAGLGQVE
ncbi:hypothetical protein NB311A_05433 [Nitrobacter sp. Nb-311A]|nr:hypothetical protein NB311A_05433 [Nitrobacter sp. Nb-311A]